MSTDTDLPLNLYRTSLQLQLRIAGLVQESALKWLELGKYAMDDDIAESAAEAEQLLKTRDWQTLTTLPGEAFWHQLLLGFGDAEAAARIALDAQTSFVAGLQDAIQTWQKETVRIVGEAGAATLSGTWSQFSPGTAATATAAKKSA
jgi:hypothetical protein